MIQAVRSGHDPLRCDGCVADQPLSAQPMNPNVTLRGVWIENCGTGIKAIGGYIVGDRVSVIGCNIGIDAVDARIEISELDIRA